MKIENAENSLKSHITRLEAEKAALVRLVRAWEQYMSVRQDGGFPASVFESRAELTRLGVEL